MLEESSLLVFQFLKCRHRAGTKSCVGACMTPLMLDISYKINAKMDLWFVFFKLSNTVNFSIVGTRGEQQPDDELS